MTRRPPMGAVPQTRREALAAERAAARARVRSTATDPRAAALLATPELVDELTADVPRAPLPTRPRTRREARSREPLTRPRRRPARTVPRIVPFAIGLAALVGIAGAGAQALRPDTGTIRPVAGFAATDDDVDAAATSASSPPSSPASSPAATPTGTPQADSTQPSGAPAPGATGAAGAVTADDALAGIVSTAFETDGSGAFSTVPGAQAAPGRGRVRTFRVQVEKGLAIDAKAFAAFVFATLNDPHGWGAGGTMRFARTDGAADFTVLLASPSTSARLCLPLRTGGTLSCRNGESVVLTIYRWVKGTADYGDNRTDYRRYLVSHEVGHFLGHGHVPCPGQGKKAPVMMQQTKGLDGCARNPWPNP